MYDYENRVTRIYRMDGLSEIDVALYAYDALGRRIWKHDPTAAAADVYTYYNDQWQILCEYTAETTCRQWFSYGNYIDEVLSRNTHPTAMIPMLYYVHDHLYSPAALTNASGLTVWERYEYDAYGKVTITGRGADLFWYTADDVTLTVSNYNNPFTFTGRQLDILDGGSLHHMHYRHRDYSPELGRFMQYDPLQYEDGLNLYEYVSSMPVFFLDPYGLVQLDASCVDWGNKSDANGRKLEDMKRSIKHACKKLNEQIEKNQIDPGVAQCMADYCSDSSTGGIKINCKRSGEGECGSNNPGGYYKGRTGEINICVDSFNPNRYPNNRVGPPYTYPAVDGNKYTFGDTAVHEIGHACLDDTNLCRGKKQHEYDIGPIPGFNRPGPLGGNYPGYGNWWQ